MNNKNTNSEDCYFYLENDSVKALCKTCKIKFKCGWFYPAGSGYGPWDIICSKCNHVIHKHNENNDQTSLQV